jgi:hypothetical protein
LAKDPGEIHDLADQEPERMEKMTKLWDQYVHQFLEFSFLFDFLAGLDSVELPGVTDL